MKKLYFIFLFVSIVVICPTVSYAHSGRTDSNGGHYNRKTGGYHYHNSRRSYSKPKRIASTDKPVAPTPIAQKPAKSKPRSPIPFMPRGAQGKSVSLPVFPEIDFSGHQPCRVIRVVDGDTIVVIRDGSNVSIRLQGVDTPETKHPSKPVQAYGKEASLFLANLLQGEKVYLLPVGDKFHTGKYGRIIAYVYRAPDGLFVNAEIIRQGYGHAYPKYPGKHTGKFCRLEAFAKEVKKGLWGGNGAIPSNVITNPQSPSVQQKAITVFRTRTGKKYHRGSCSYLRRSSFPLPLKDAKARGLEPCSRCCPPN